jgi:citrate synthase
MPTALHDLMSSPPVTCDADTLLDDVTSLMHSRQIGSVVVTDGATVVGILTERDLLRASATSADAGREPVRRWMTADPDVLGLDEEVGAAWPGLTHHHYRHLPVVDHGDLVGVVSMRDLLSVAQIRPAGETDADVPRGLEGVVVAETSIGDVRGQEGFFHYRQYSAVDLASHRSLEDVWQLLFDGALPDPEAAARFADEVADLRFLPPELVDLLSSLASMGSPLDALRTGISLLGTELGWRPSHDIGHDELRAQALRLCSVVPTMLTAVFRLQAGMDPVPPRNDLSHAANYLWMLLGEEAPPAHVRAIEQYLILTIDHGFNASTFAARVIASTGADLAAAIVGAVGALSGPLHGGAPSRALDMLDGIGTPDRAEAWIRDAVSRGDRIMGFGHRVYKTDDPRSVFLRSVARSLGGPLVEFAEQVEAVSIDVLADMKPGRRLRAPTVGSGASSAQSAGTGASSATGWCSTHWRWRARRSNFHPDAVRRYRSAYRMNQTTSVPARGSPARSPSMADTWWATHCTSPAARSPSTASWMLDT